MTKKEKIRKIWEYQLNDYVDELTCGKDNCGSALTPQELDGEVILRCLRQGCDYIQKYIHEFVLQANLKNNFVSELGFLIKRAKLFPGCFTQDELQEAERLIKNAQETEKKCGICLMADASRINKRIADTDVCRFHARYLIHREREE